MPLKLKAEKLNAWAAKISENTRLLNIECADLNGVAAKIPEGTPPPLSQLIGHKVILHNVSYCAGAGGITASITVPYGKDLKGNEFTPGGKYRFCIDETWFND